jgi:HEPN domain.
MSYLKNKSEINFSSAELLYQNDLYPSSVHCAYYSCVQLMKYIISDKIGINYEKQASEISQLKNQKAKRRGSHNYMIDKIEEVMLTVDKKEANSFVGSIEDLKEFREESDYENIDILSVKSRDSILKADLIRKQLINFFHV